MTNGQEITRDNETVFEDHFCHQLEVKGKYRLYKDSELNIDKELCLYFADLEEFLQNTQQEKLLQLKDQLGPDWKRVFAERFKQELADKQFFQLLKDGIEINNIYLDLVYFKPSREDNELQAILYNSNRFTAVRQYHFGEESQRESIDITLLVNGFVIVTIELKNQGTSGDYSEAIKQYLRRSLHLPIFKQPFLHIVCDNETAKMAASFSNPPNEKDFRDYNMELVNVASTEQEYPVHYLYHDILLPERLMNYLETYLYPGQDNKWIFPRFHQQRATRKVINEIENSFIKNKELDLRLLIQHSTGSGKSNTIVWMVQNLRNAYAGNEKIFDSIVVLTDRVNLDDQISKDFMKAIHVEGITAYPDNAQELKKALEDNKKVIVTTIHKFSYITDVADQTGKRICIIIDEAHRSQEGRLADNMTATFNSNEEGIEPALKDSQEELLEEIERKKFPNMAFIALTATPSEKTLEHFGRKAQDENGNPIWEAHDTYSMDQAISEGYIMDVAKHIYSYDTIYELNKEVDSGKEYLPMLVRRALRQKAYEDSEIIREKCKRILQVFRQETADKIQGKAKAMVVSSSRLAAVKYKIFLDEEIKKVGLNYKTLVAFSGNIEYENDSYTEESMNKNNNPLNMKIEDVFEADNEIRFLIVANKYQTGFDEPLLHTMFVDKPLRDRNAVQTLSRLNRVYPGKTDTLVVDFTGSYEDIMKAYKRYQKNIISYKTSDPKELFALKEKLLKYAVFTESDIRDVADLGKSNDSRNMPAIAGILYRIKKQFEENLNREKRDEVRILINRYIGIFNYVTVLYKVPHKELWDFQVFLIYLNNKITNSDFNSLKKEIEDVKVVKYAIPEIEREDKDDDDANNNTGGGGSPNVTQVRQTKTVKEVIEIINLKYRTLITDDGVQVIGEYLEDVTHDENLKEIIKNNQQQSPESVYFSIMREKLRSKLQDIVMEKTPDLYERITSEKVMPFINKTAYDLLRNIALSP